MSGAATDSMNWARLVLDYLHIFVWPVALLVVVIRFRGAIGALMGRMANESQEFSASFLGVELAAKFQEKAATLAQQAEAAESPELREEIRQAAQNLAVDAFRALASQFDDAPLSVRREIAHELERAADSVSWTNLVPLADSPSLGERVGATIGLRVQLRQSPEARDQPDVLAVVAKLLADRDSRVRYRAAELLRAIPELLPTFDDDLRTLAERDRNSFVREMARKALGADA